MKNLTLRQIKIFLCATKHLNFTRAAEELHVTAPAVSLQIKEMEKDMGVILFDRDGRKVELTAAGEYFIVYARRVLWTLNDANTMMDRFRGTQAGALKIGLVSTAQYFLPKMLAQFKADHPNVQLKIEVRNRLQLIELLREGDIDIAIMGRPPQEIDTRIETFANHPHAFIASKSHPLADKANIPPMALKRFDFITRESGSGTRIILENYLNEHSIVPFISMEMSSNETVKQAVMANLGISFVSLHTVGFEINQGQIAILDVQDTPVMRAWHVVALNKRNSSQAAEAFRYFMLEKGGEILSEMFPNMP